MIRRGRDYRRDVSTHADEACPLLCESHLLIVCLSGETKLLVGRRELTLAPGRVALVNPWQPYRIADGQGETLYLHLPIPVVRRLVRDRDLSGWTRPQFVASSSCVGTRELGSLTDLRARGEQVWADDALLSRRGLERLVRRVFVEMSTAFVPRQRSTLLTGHPKINRVLRFLTNADVETVGSQSLSSLSERAGLSKFHFVRTFHDEVGVSPHQYLRAMRLGVAARFLRETRHPVRSIAQRVGYASVSSFSRSFSEHMGQTPTAFRKSTVKAAA